MTSHWAKFHELESLEEGLITIVNMGLSSMNAVSSLNYQLTISNGLINVLDYVGRDRNVAFPSITEAYWIAHISRLQTSGLGLYQDVVISDVARTENLEKWLVLSAG
jgi:hypothetical protein